MMRLKHLRGMVLSATLSLPVRLGLGLGLNPPSDFFRTWPAGVRAHAERLRRLKKTVAQGWSIRQSSSAEYVLMLYLYCREATAGKATYRHIADLLNAGWEASGIDNIVNEDVVRMQVRRLQRARRRRLYSKMLRDL